MDGYLGMIMGWAPNYAPRGWMFCHGQILPVQQFTALFSLLGTTYGGDGRTTFMLPDLRGRIPVGAGQGPGTRFYEQGASLGSETVALDVHHLPAHSHAASTQDLRVSFPASSNPASTDTPAPNLVPAKMATDTGRGEQPTKAYAEGATTTLQAGTVTGEVVIGHAGGSQPFEIVQPVLAIQYIICVEGLYPPRP